MRLFAGNIVGLIAAALVSLAVLIYIGDWLVLQLRERSGTANGSVLVESTDVVREKGGKVEYYYNPPQPTACVNSIFPHQGQPACWWLLRHNDQQRFIN